MPTNATDSPYKGFMTLDAARAWTLLAQFVQAFAESQVVGLG
jgi:hypothetical protein